MKWFYFVILVFHYLFAYGQDSLLYVDLEDVKISATRIEVSQLSAPISLHKIRINPLESGYQNFSVNEFLSSIPGIFTLNQYNSAQDVRVSLRGFGSRSAFGIRGVKMIMDGIPLSTPDGQGQVDNILIGAIKDLEVINGSSSALYGNASGGVISLNTFSDSEEDLQFASVNVGSFRDLKLTYHNHSKRGNNYYDNQLSYGSNEGFRDHSRSANLIYNGRLKRKFSNKQELSLILNSVYSPRGEDPGGINLEDATSNPTMARPQNVAFKAGEEVFQVTGGVKYRVDLGKMRSLTSTGFYTRRSFDNRLPFSIGGQVNLLRNYGGVTFQFGQKLNWRSWENEVVVGADIAYQNDHRIRYFNLSGERGDETLNQNEIFSNQAVFLNSIARNGKLLFNAGLRIDRNLIQLKDHFESDGIDDGSISLPSISPSLSWSYNIKMLHYISASFSYGFETPTLSELSSRPDHSGGLNTALRPQQSYNYELGYKARIADQIVINASIFAINSEDELLPYELEGFPGRTFYRNAGRTSRQGIEMSAQSMLSKSLKLKIAYSYSDFKFTEFEEFDDNRIPGIPQHNFSGNFVFEGQQLLLQYRHNYYSSIFTTNANDIKVSAYQLASISVARKQGWIRPFVGINNLLNAKNYFDNIRINAFGGRFYEPGPPRNYYVGVKFEF